ncbi:MAG: YceD family protein [Oscillospiraceae bacterium]
MLFDLKKVFATYDAPIHTTESMDLSAEDFPGYTVENPVEAHFTATLEGSVMKLDIEIPVTVLAQCARCLDDIRKEFVIEKTYMIRDAEWKNSETELSYTPEGKLDLKELVYTELVLEIPTKLLCSENCAGLCPVCGNRKPCSCEHETSDAIDERLLILKQLLN